MWHFHRKIFLLSKTQTKDTPKGIKNANEPNTRVPNSTATALE